MLKFNHMEQLDSVNIRDAEDITLDNIKEMIKSVSQEKSVPMAFYMEEVKTSGLFGDPDPALVVYHPDHRNDFFNLVVLLSCQGSYARLDVYATGKSKQMGKFNQAEINREMRKGKSMSFQIANAAVSGLLGLGRSKQKLADEQMWYQICLDTIGQATLG